MRPRRALKKVLAGAAVLLCGTAAACGLTSCGGASPSEPHPIRTIGAHPDIEVTEIAGGKHTPQFEAIVAEERTKKLGPASDLEPLLPSRFVRPVHEYRTYSERQAKAVRAEVAKLQGDLRTGDRAAAKTDLLAAYDHYLRLGAAYGALGKLDEEIDGDPGWLPGGARSPEFTGFHRVEMGLWSGEPTAALIRPAAYLAARVRRLKIVARTIRIDPLTYATRAHEILEDAQRDMLSGIDAPWSGAGLRATAASLAATGFVVRTLRPLLAGRDSTVEPAETELARLRQVLEEMRRANGGAWPALSSLTQIDHERVDGALGSALERLAAIPGALETSRTVPVPTIAAQKRAGAE